VSSTLETPEKETTVYVAPLGGIVQSKELLALDGAAEGRRFVFYEDLRIGRLKHHAPPLRGTLYVADPSVSSKHCVITQDAYGRCFIRDTSLNGTWIDGRRLVPGTEVELRVGQTISIAQVQSFRLEGDAADARTRVSEATHAVSAPIEVSVLIGDIRHYTTLVREAPPELVQASVNALFPALERIVTEFDGTPKEYPGDAILAYWEAGNASTCAARACRAVLALAEAARRLADDASVWLLRDHPLEMEWALATGLVMIQRLGGAHPLGLSMIGEPIVKAYRLEKLADEDTGPILVCNRTQSLAAKTFSFRPLGERTLDGFMQPEMIHALLERP